MNDLLSGAGLPAIAASHKGETATIVPGGPPPVLSVRNLTRTFGKLRAVDDVSFEAGRGEVLGFIGPNGAGKTTTMRIIATLDLPQEGDVFVCGESVIDYPDRVRKKIGYMPDSFGKYANMNVLDYLDFFARAYGLRGVERRAAVEHVLVFTELRKLQHKAIKSLSKGMSQRLGLGRTLIHNPELLILDEPAAGLDPRGRVELRELVQLLARELNKTILISSHILTELGEICDSAVIIEAGKILASGRVADLQKRQRSRRAEDHVTSLSISLIDSTEPLEREAFHKWLVQQPFVLACQESGSRLRIDFGGDPRQQHELLRRMLGEGFPVTEFSGKVETLEDAFMDITRGITQ